MESITVFERQPKSYTLDEYYKKCVANMKGVMPPAPRFNIGDVVRWTDNYFDETSKRERIGVVVEVHLSIPVMAYSYKAFYFDDGQKQPYQFVDSPRYDPAKQLFEAPSSADVSLVRASTLEK